MFARAQATDNDVGLYRLHCLGNLRVGFAAQVVLLVPHSCSAFSPKLISMRHPRTFMHAKIKITLSI
jgi:hypothetical protein